MKSGAQLTGSRDDAVAPGPLSYTGVPGRHVIFIPLQQGPSSEFLLLTCQMELCAHHTHTHGFGKNKIEM